MLRVDICAMKRFEQVDPQQELRQQIQQRKQAIYAYRNRLLSEILGQPITALSFACTCHGKPYLKEHNLAINHTHSKKIYALVTSSEQQDIGIDVEDLERQVKLDALAQHAFHEEEYQTRSLWIKTGCTGLKSDSERSNFKGQWFRHPFKSERYKYQSPSHV